MEKENKNILITVFMKVTSFMVLNKDMENISHKINKLFIKENLNKIKLLDKEN